jgi:hypothetical protein
MLLIPTWRCGGQAQVHLRSLLNRLKATPMTRRQVKVQEEIHFLIMRILQENPVFTQCELADQSGISVGGVNCCLQAFIDKGLVKMLNFQNSKNKFKYLYLLTPQGIA